MLATKVLHRLDRGGVFGRDAHVHRICIRVRRARRSGFAEYFGGDSLGDFADVASVGEEQCAPRMRVDVDESG
jgi:hypothetical protein